MSFDIVGNVVVNIQNGYASVSIERVEYESSINSRSGSVLFKLWATTTPYSGGTITGYELVEYQPTNSTLPNNWYYSNINFGGEIPNIPGGTYYLTVTVSEYQGNDYYIDDYTAFTNLWNIAGGGGGGGGGGTPGAPIYGDDTSEALYGSNNADVVYGRGGDDSVYGYDGNDRLFGQAGNDMLLGGEGNDTLIGGGGNDLLSAFNGDDVVRGGAGNDNVGGNAGNDLVIGGAGNDFLFGDHPATQPGRDTLNGGLGADVIEGGPGADRFIYNSIRDFRPSGIWKEEIGDFNGAEGDEIVLSRIDANALRSGNQDFIYIGGNGFTGRAGQLRFANEKLMGDVNGDRRADFTLILEDVNFLSRYDIVL